MEPGSQRDVTASDEDLETTVALHDYLNAHPALAACLAGLTARAAAAAGTDGPSATAYERARQEFTRDVTLAALAEARGEHSWPAIAAYKNRARELVRGAIRVVEVGFGQGSDLLALGVERCIGVDRSLAMCAIAAERRAVVCQADARHLPLRDQCCDAVVLDRVLHLIADPQPVVAAAVRLLSDGGRIIVAHPDDAAAVIELPTVNGDLIARVKTWKGGGRVEDPPSYRGSPTRDWSTLALLTSLSNPSN